MQRLYGVPLLHFAPILGETQAGVVRQTQIPLHALKTLFENGRQGSRVDPIQQLDGGAALQGGEIKTFATDRTVKNIGLAVTASIGKGERTRRQGLGPLVAIRLAGERQGQTTSGQRHSLAIIMHDPML